MTDRKDHRAVVTAATLLRAYSKTVHARQCLHGTEMDEFYTALDKAHNAVWLCQH